LYKENLLSCRLTIPTRINEMGQTMMEMMEMMEAGAEIMGIPMEITMEVPLVAVRYLNR
jgi:hypothetical protein